MARGRKKTFENWLADLELRHEMELRPDGEMGPCGTCEFCFPAQEDSNSSTGWICADAHYGQALDPNESTIRDCWSIGPDEYSDRLAKSEKGAPKQDELQTLYQQYLDE